MVGTFSEGRDEKNVHKSRSVSVTEQRYLVGVAAERVDVFFDPVQSGHQVVYGVVPGGAAVLRAQKTCVVQ